MYGIFYNNRQSKIMECLATFESFKAASRQFYAVVSKYIDIEPSIRPMTLWKTKEFDMNKIRQSTNMGYWIKMEDKSAIIYRKQPSNGWFTSSKIKEIGCFCILDIPEITKVEIIIPKKQKIIMGESTNFQHGRHVSLIDELKIKLKNRVPTSINIPQKEIKNDHNIFLNELKQRCQDIFNTK